jgi:hypothetical protein
MVRPLFLPTLRQSIILAIVGALALACGFYLRYSVIENAVVGIACGSHAQTWLCAARRATIALFEPQALGMTAVAGAVLNLIRPSIVLCVVALAAGGLGIVLYNVAMSALAVALLILGLARPAPASD